MNKGKKVLIQLVVLAVLALIEPLAWIIQQGLNRQEPYRLAIISINQQAK